VERDSKAGHSSRDAPLPERDTAKLALVQNAEDDCVAKNTEVTICGVLTGITRKRNRDGKPWCVMALEDRTGSVEALCFATNYERLAAQIMEDTAVMVRGLVLPEENTTPKLSAVALDNARIDLPGVLAIRVWIGRDGGVDRAAALEEVFKRKPGATSVRLRLEAPRDFPVLLDVPAKVRPDREFTAAVERICGPACVEKVAG